MSDNPNEWHTTLRARIEALTAEVRRWQALFDEKHNLMLEHKVRAEKAEAERDRLREALECLEIAATGVGVPHPQERKLLHEAIADARAALKGETP